LKIHNTQKKIKVENGARERLSSWTLKTGNWTLDWTYGFAPILKYLAVLVEEGALTPRNTHMPSDSRAAVSIDDEVVAFGFARDGFFNGLGQQVVAFALT